MKKSLLATLLIIGALALSIMAGPAAAATGIQGEAGVKLDMPDLVRFSPDVTLGMEASKGMYAIEPHGLSHWIEDDKDYQGLVKLTVKWTLIDFSKKK